MVGRCVPLSTGVLPCLPLGANRVSDVEKVFPGLGMCYCCGNIAATMLRAYVEMRFMKLRPVSNALSRIVRLRLHAAKLGRRNQLPIGLMVKLTARRQWHSVYCGV